MGLSITPAGGSVALLDDVGDVIITSAAANDVIVRNSGNTAWINSTGLTLSGAFNVSTAAAVSAGTDAQGQGALTADYNVITTAANNPSGVTLPTATAGRRLVVVNKGANRIKVYPASGGTIDARSINTSISIPVNGQLEFWASSTTQWYTTANVSYEGTLFTLVDETDNTKVARFNLSGITTGTTRVYSLPNTASETLAGLGTAQTFSAAQTFSSGVTMSATANAIDIGGTTGTNTISVGRSTGAQILNLGTGATTGGVTKTINIGTAATSGNITAINIGSAVAGSTSTVKFNRATAISDSVTVQDSSFILQETSDNTKRAYFVCSTIATGTTRTFTFPNASGTLALTSDITAGALTTEKAIALSWGGFI